MEEGGKEVEREEWKGGKRKKGVKKGVNRRERGEMRGNAISTVM